MSEISPTLLRLAHLIEDASGNVVNATHLPFLGDAASTRARARGLPDTTAYVEALARGALVDEWRSLLPLVTIKESYLFRTPQHFAAISGTILPELLPRRVDSHRLRVWSAGCARGEEPATLAIVLAESAALDGWDWRILATDVDEDALGIGRTGIYTERPLAQVPPSLLARYFKERNGSYELVPQLRERIDFRFLNLVREPFLLPEPSFDLILLRNVLIYFRPESQRRVADAVAQALAPDGVLFVGPSETLWQLTERLEPRDLGECFCYRSSQPIAAKAASRPGHPTSRPLYRPAPPAAPRPDGHATLAQPLPPLPEPSDPFERSVRSLAAGDLDVAREQAAAARQARPTDAGVHALEGLISDITGEDSAAVGSYRAALFVDPQLFQVRLLLADCLRRQGAGERAVHEYRTTLATLASASPHELPFAGGLGLPDREVAARRARAALTYPA